MTRITYLRVDNFALNALLFTPILAIRHKAVNLGEAMAVAVLLDAPRDSPEFHFLMPACIPFSYVDSSGFHLELKTPAVDQLCKIWLYDFLVFGVSILSIEGMLIPSSISRS